MVLNTNVIQLSTAIRWKSWRHTILVKVSTKNTLLGKIVVYPINFTKMDCGFHPRPMYSQTLAQTSRDHFQPISHILTNFVNFNVYLFVSLFGVFRKKNPSHYFYFWNFALQEVIIENKGDNWFKLHWFSSKDIF